MRYRILGRTGLHVSELSLGGHEYRRRLNPVHHPTEWDQEEFLKTQPQRNQVIEKAIAAGINYFDTTLREEALSLGFALTALKQQDKVFTASMISTGGTRSSLVHSRGRMRNASRFGRGSMRSTTVNPHFLSAWK